MRLWGLTGFHHVVNQVPHPDVPGFSSEQCLQKFHHLLFAPSSSVNLLGVKIQNGCPLCAICGAQVLNRMQSAQVFLSPCATSFMRALLPDVLRSLPSSGLRFPMRHTLTRRTVLQDRRVGLLLVSWDLLSCFLAFCAVSMSGLAGQSAVRPGLLCVLLHPMPRGLPSSGHMSGTGSSTLRKGLISAVEAIH